MDKRSITVEGLFSFALRNDGHDFKTIARSRKFTLQASSERIRILLPSLTHFNVNMDFAKLYVQRYNNASPEQANRTTPYPKEWRERSYMVKIMHMVRDELETGNGHVAAKRATIVTRKIFSQGAIEPGTAQAPRIKWTRDELLIALNLYHKLTFGRMDARNPTIITVAEKMGRGANSLALKLVNFASLDPALRMRGIEGMSGASALDRLVWAEFHENLSEAAPASEQAFQKLFGPEEGNGVEVIPKKGIRPRPQPSGSTDRWSNTKQRRGQDYFRDSVLNNFGGCCGVTGLAVRELLIASHILPWGEYEAERLNVRNGICLSRLHDAAFDNYLISFDENLRLVLSPRLKGALSQRAVKENFAAYEGEALQLSKDAVLPDEKFLAVHRAEVFRK